MRRWLLLLALGLAASAPQAACAEGTNAAPPAGYEALIGDAVRYGNTPARRAAKDAARAELIGRGAESLRELMDRAHVENVMLQVLIQELARVHLEAGVVTPVLMAYLEDPHVETRRLAAYLLGFHPPPPEPERLLPLLAEEKTRNAALRTLGKWKMDAARAEAVRLLENGAPERARVLAVNALRDVGNPDDLPVLIRALGDPVFTVRNAASSAVASHGRAAHGPLRKALGRTEGAALRQVVRLVGELRVGFCQFQLRRLLRTAEPGLRADIEAAFR